MSELSSGTPDPIAMQRSRLLELLRIHAFQRRTVTLSSGKTSDFYIETAACADGDEQIRSIARYRYLAGTNIGFERDAAVMAAD